MNFKMYIGTLMFILMFNTVHPISISQGVVINTSSSNTSLTFNVEAFMDRLEVNSNSILLNNTGYNNSELVVNITSQQLNLTDISSSLLRSEFPHLTFSNDTNKNISSNITQTLNITVRINVRNCNIDLINYTSNTGAFNETFTSANFTLCESNKVTFNIIGLEQAASSNLLLIEYLAILIDNVIKIIPNEPQTVPHLQLRKRLIFP